MSKQLTQDEQETLAVIKGVTAVVAVIVLIILFFSSYTVVSPGNTGVVFNKITGSLRTAPQGMVWRFPFFTRVQSYPTALRTYTLVAKTGEGSSNEDDSIDLPTKEGQHIKQDISVTYNTSEARAAEVFRSFRGDDIGDIENTFIRRTIITVTQNLSGQMSLTDIISGKRQELQDEIQSKLQAEFVKMGFVLDKVNLGASHLPEAIEHQMQQKMAVQQEAQQAQFELQKQQMLAQAAVAKAHGEADSQVVRAKAQSEANKLLQVTLTPMVIQQQALEKWDGALPQVTGGSIPMIQLPGLKKAEAVK